jgi:hypothetical protein
MLRVRDDTGVESRFCRPAGRCGASRAGKGVYGLLWAPGAGHFDSLRKKSGISGTSAAITFLAHLKLLIGRGRLDEQCEEDFRCGGIRFGAGGEVPIVLAKYRVRTDIDLCIINIFYLVNIALHKIPPHGIF